MRRVRLDYPQDSSRKELSECLSKAPLDELLLQLRMFRIDKAAHGQAMPALWSTPQKHRTL